MARVADYTIIADGWVLQFDQDTVNFEVPATIDTGSRSILGFMVHVDNDDDLTLKLKLNDTQVWHWKFPDGNRVQFFQEVITAGIIKPGKNVFKFESSSEDFNLVELSDIVLWWQANI